MTNESKKSYKCRYCDKQYRKESTLAVHNCEAKRRWQQEKEVGVQLGLRAYLRFYEVTQGSAKNKNYASFAESSYYRAFVKFGRYLVDIRAVNPYAFIDYVIKQNKKLDHWCHDKIYQEYLVAQLRRESVQDAVERSLLEMQRYADQQLSGNFADYFRKASPNKVCQDIANGRVSAWAVYNSESGVDFLGNLNEEQLTIVMPWIDPDFWQKRFRDYLADAEWARYVTRAAGL